MLSIICISLSLQASQIEKISDAQAFTKALSAIYNNDLTELERHLTNNPSIVDRKTEESKRTLLHIAASRTPTQIANSKIYLKMEARYQDPEQNHKNIINALIKAKSDINAVDKYNLTPAYISVFCDNSDATEILAQQTDIDLTKPNLAGYTTLDIAHMKENSKAIEILSKAGVRNLSEKYQVELDKCKTNNSTFIYGQKYQ